MRFTSNNKRQPRSAFTLIELVIAVALAAMALGAAYACLSAGFASQKMVEPRLDAVQNARVAMASLSADLRAACPLSQDYDFLGAQREIDGAEADNLDFGCQNYTPQRPGEGDFCQLSYFVEKDPSGTGLVLWRRRNPRFAPEPLSGGPRAVIARGLSSVQFEYYDGLDWYSKWGETTRKSRHETSSAANLSGLPEAVRITLAVNPAPRSAHPIAATNAEPPLLFQTTVRLELAAQYQNNSTAASGGNPATPGSNPTSP